ncbi:MAG: DNA polymerase IV [Chloroflexi bacterium]|nr:DNA polymerase IV [Chloroflexota bacterium]
MATARTIMHVDLDAFFVSVEQARDPTLRGKPVIVGGDPNGRGVVATASYEARPYGIHSGMALSVARRLCPQAIFVRGTFREYERVSQRFHGILRDYSPLVEPMGLDEAFLDLTGCAPVIGARSAAGRALASAEQPDEQAARVAGESIRRRVREELAVTASVGIASGKIVAKVASDSAKPDGLLTVPAGGEAAFFAPRPVRELPGLGRKAEAALASLGVRTLGQLATLHTTRLQRLFGKWGPVLSERARGIDPSPVAFEREPAKSVSREGTYARDVDDIAVLRASLRGYAESVGADLRRLGRRAHCVSLKLRYGDFTTISRSRTLKRPTFSDEELYRTATELLERALSRDGRAVRLIGLGVSQLTDDVVQLGLFERRQLPGEALLHSIDRLRAKYGYRCLQTGLTFFDPYVSSPDWSPDRHTGLSSQVGLESDS